MTITETLYNLDTSVNEGISDRLMLLNIYIIDISDSEDIDDSAECSIRVVR